MHAGPEPSPVHCKLAWKLTLIMYQEACVVFRQRMP